jgi:hypothetical protein
MSDSVATQKTNKESGSKERLHNLPLISPAAAASPTLVKSEEWRPPVQRHVDKSGTLLFSSLRVRILSGDVERNYSIQFKESPLKVSTVCAAISVKEGISSETAKYFRLWIVGKDLELQLGDEQVIDTIIAEWPLRCGFDCPLECAHY